MPHEFAKEKLRVDIDTQDEQIRQQMDRNAIRPESTSVSVEPFNPLKAASMNAREAGER